MSFGGNFGGNDEYDGFDGFDEDEDYPPPLMDTPLIPPPFMKRPFNRNARYNEAYGNYRGGYGPGGGFGPMPMPMRPPGPMPPRLWGGNFGPGGPPFRKNRYYDHQAIKYLIRCGVTKDSLKNLPHDLLNLIEPEYCGLCAMSLDNFTISKMHYISKNHSKNQKKWLSQTIHSNPKEYMPLKARELYCELCDVQMTSKTHADAHYSGKPHGAIVLGRKNPKNPILLQNGMKNRLNQLIHREKRCLSKMTESKTEEEAPKEAKNVPPELYCEICKTAVTCSEQMTMHMNGKKHLSKEKQYILKQMKGNTDSADVEKKEEQMDEDWGEPWDQGNGNEKQGNGDQEEKLEDKQEEQEGNEKNQSETA